LKGSEILNSQRKRKTSAVHDNVGEAKTWRCQYAAIHKQQQKRESSLLVSPSRTRRPHDKRPGRKLPPRFPLSNKARMNAIRQKLTTLWPKPSSWSAGSCRKMLP